MPSRITGMEYGALAMGKELAEKAVKRTENTEVTNTERVGYTVSPIMQGTIDLVQGDSLAEVGDKMIKTTVKNGKAVADAAKAFTEGLNALGFKVTDSNKKLNFGWSIEDIASRYAMAFVGGTIGGALFQANHTWETRNIPKWVKDAENSDLSKFTYLIAQGRSKEIRDYYKKLHEKGLLGDSNLSASKLYYKNVKKVKHIFGKN